MHGPPFLYDSTHSVGLPHAAPGAVPVDPVAGLWFQEGVLASRLLLQIGAAFLSLECVRFDCQSGADMLIWGDFHLL